MVISSFNRPARLFIGLSSASSPSHGPSPSSCCQVPANRIGFVGNGGPFSLVQLKVIQECVSLIVFAVIAHFMFQGEALRWNHLLAFCFLIAAVYLVFK